MICEIQAAGSIELYAYGELSPIACAHVRAHLERCAECRRALDDLSPDVRIVAAQAIAHHGHNEDRPKALSMLSGLSDGSRNDVFVTLAALGALDALGARAAPIAEALGALSGKVAVPDPRYAPYVPRLLQDVQARLKSTGAGR